MSHRTNGKSATGPSSVRYLPCSAEPGMFKGELLVHFTGFNPDHVDETIQVQMLVDQNEVKGLRGQPMRHAPVDGFVFVTLLGEVRGLAEVILPQPAQPVGQRLLVRATDLVTEVAA